MAEAPPPGVTHWDGPALSAWKPWPPYELMKRVAGAQIPWAVCGGWAIDLFLGEETRAHEDIEIEILRADFPKLRDWLRPLEFYVVGDGEVRALAPGALPPDDKHQTWLCDPGQNIWLMDAMLQEGDAATWVCRRKPALTAPRDSIVAKTRFGVPYLKPEAVLLFKAKATRPKDEADFANVVPRMDADARAWLKDALAKTHAAHHWIAQL
jgi:hypothetical protein